VLSAYDSHVAQVGTSDVWLLNASYPSWAPAHCSCTSASNCVIAVGWCVRV
jgi:hypothetical protein